MAQHEDQDLQRFVRAQEGVYTDALSEIRAGRKRTHWMWFIFPQIQGLGRSSTARYYAIRSLEEAQAYLNHPKLGRRLAACAEAVLALDVASISDVFGYPDTLKLRSSMTLFALLDGAPLVFSAVIDRHFSGHQDKRTLELVKQREEGDA